MDNKPSLYPRKVKTPRPWRENRMEFCTAKQDYNVAEYYDTFGHTLPKIVKVNQGFCGDIVQDTFDREQVMRLHAVSKQKRVIARFKSSGQKRLVSIPVTYEIKMCVLDKKGKPSKEQTLAAIVKENTLPVNVQLSHDKKISIGNQTLSSNWIPRMELVQTFDEMYFLSNFIIDGVLVTEVTPVPLYLKQLRLVEVTGIQGQPKGKWDSYCTQLKLACERFHYDHGFGNSEVAMYDPSANYTDTTYSYVEPTIYSPMSSFFKKRTFGNPSYTITEEPEEAVAYPDKGGDVYEEIGESQLGPRPSGNPNDQLKSELTRRIEGREHSRSIAVPAPVPPPLAPKPVYPATTTTSGGRPSLPVRQATTYLSTSTRPPNTFHDNAYSNVATKFIADPPMPKTEPAVTIDDTTSKKAEEVKELNGPEDVAKLSIDELCTYLDALNLGHYVDKFKDQLVDGPLLVELGKDVFKEDFGMKSIEAIRLERFAKTGHVPK